MALYMKQDFNPPMLSKKWIAMQVRPNMLLYARQHITNILESGLLFREDSVEVEQEASWQDEGGEWLTRGEKVVGVTAMGAAVALLPPNTDRIGRTTLLQLAAYLSVPWAIRAIHRRLCHGALQQLLNSMRDYLALARRAAACLKECQAFRAQLDSVSSVLESMHTLLCRQQSSLTVLLMRASSALLGNAPWLRADLAWDATPQLQDDNLLRIHHAFLVVQSSLLKHIAMAHQMPSAQAKRLYKNHNERVYWIHAVLLTHLIEEYLQATDDHEDAMEIETQDTLKTEVSQNEENIHPIKTATDDHEDAMEIETQDSSKTEVSQNKENVLPINKNYEALERMYRLLKNYGNSDANINKRPGTAIKDSWLCSEVHSGIARANLELKLALSKCNELDVFLDSCALNKHNVDLDILNKDIDGLIDHITKCLTTVQNSQIRLKKLKNKFSETSFRSEKSEAVEKEFEDADVLKIEGREPETKDEVFYFVKTEDDEKVPECSGDISTAPGKKERETTNIVLNELRRKLVRREDVMRERERQALAKSMPDEKVPEFPRQINMVEYADKKGYMTKLPTRTLKRRLFHNYKIKPPKAIETTLKIRRLKRKINRYTPNTIISNAFNSTLYDAKSNFSRSKFFKSSGCSDTTIVTQYRHEWTKQDMEDDSSWFSEGLSDVEASTTNKSVSQAVNLEANLPVDNLKVSSDNKQVENGKDNKTLNQEARNYRFSKRDLEITSSSESDSDFEAYKVKQVALLKDIRRNRAARKKNHPEAGTLTQPSSTIDESLRPMEYSFGTGLAMASVLRTDGSGALGLRSGPEELFVGDGEVSPDSGHEAQA